MMMTEQATNDAIDGKEEKYAAYMKRIIELRQEFSKWKQIYEVCQHFASLLTFQNPGGIPSETEDIHDDEQSEDEDEEKIDSESAISVSTKDTALSSKGDEKRGKRQNFGLQQDKRGKRVKANSEKRYD